jgi:hypothetical protein
LSEHWVGKWPQLARALRLPLQSSRRVASAAIFYHSQPREALLAATVTFVFVLAAVVALFAWRDPVPRRQFTYWDAAGLLTLIGVMASAMLEPGDLARLVVDTERHN